MDDTFLPANDLDDLDVMWMEQFRQSLLSWFGRVARDLPWRQANDPYHIWLSEVMLQQTRVETVIPYYHRFLNRFPTVSSLADADESEVLKAWEGLGYYRRARHFHAAVREVVESYGSTIPDGYDEFRALAGVGAYTAGAVLSIAYARRIPAVDGNVLRVLSRVFGIWEPVTRTAGRRAVEQRAEVLANCDSPGDLNQALMELGATVCRGSRPECDGCPVSRMCRARFDDVQEELPVKDKKAAPRPVDVVCAVVSQGYRFLIQKRPEDGLLGGLWQFPTETVAEEKDWEDAVAELVQRQLGKGNPDPTSSFYMQVKHTYSHIQWYMRVYRVRLAELPEIAAGRSCRWVPLADIAAYPLTGAHRRIWQALTAERPISSDSAR